MAWVECNSTMMEKFLRASYVYVLFVLKKAIRVDRYGHGLSAGPIFHLFYLCILLGKWLSYSGNSFDGGVSLAVIHVCLLYLIR